MKTFASVLVVVCLFGTAACFAADNKANPADYTLDVHVSASGYIEPADVTREILTVTIGGRHYQLLGSTVGQKIRYALINPGDYRAKLTTDEHKTSYESRHQYEFLFPDGSTRRFDVIGQME